MCQTLLSALQAWSHLILLRISKFDAVIISVIQMWNQGLKKLTCLKFPARKFQSMKADLSDVSSHLLTLYWKAFHCAC